MIDLLETLQPALVLGMFILMYSLENLFPYLHQPVNRKRHYRRNLIISTFTFLLNALLGTYGDVFTFWDRIFGTWGKTQPHQIRYGLDEFNQDQLHKVGY